MGKVHLLEFIIMERVQKTTKYCRVRPSARQKSLSPCEPLSRRYPLEDDPEARYPEVIPDQLPPIIEQAGLEALPDRRQHGDSPSLPRRSNRDRKPRKVFQPIPTGKHGQSYTHDTLTA